MEEKFESVTGGKHQMYKLKIYSHWEEFINKNSIILGNVTAEQGFQEIYSQTASAAINVRMM
jgi:hypothetical protein